MNDLLCTSCANENPLAAVYCDQCGAQLRATRADDLRTQEARDEIVIGRDTESDVVLDFPMVSGRHARIFEREGRIFLEDLGSTNGTGLGSPDNPVRGSIRLDPEDTVYFGSLPVPASRLLTGHLALGETPHTDLRFEGRPMILGRDGDSDLVLDDPMVSWRHARLRRTGPTLVIEDLGSTNGTFVNGERVVKSRVVAEGDVIALGSHSVRLGQQDRLEARDLRGNVTIEARGVSIDVPARRLVEDVSLTVYPGELVGLMGPSGCGKSTLLYALNGYWNPAHGKVFFNRQELYGRYDQFRSLIGYVPQDDIIHRSLTVRQALYYSARLRLPSDFSDQQIHQRIDHTVAQLGLQGTEDTLVGSPVQRGISGGQRKRVNLAMELMSDPSVLFLDEPTSGLSSEDALVVMKVLRDLADQGKTIVLSIHQPSREAFGLMDSVIILGKDAGSTDAARLVYFGTAYPESVLYFNPGLTDTAPSPDLLLRGLSQRPTDQWTERWGASRERHEFVEQRAGTGSVTGESVDPASRDRRSTGPSQWWTLVRRSLSIKRRDTWNTGILLAQAPVIALLIVLVFGDSYSDAAPKALFVAVIAALWFGASSSAREIVGEWAIYQRERMINLGIPSYVGSKMAVLGVVSWIQCSLLTAIMIPGCDLQGGWLPMTALLALVAMIGVALGLFLSALARTSEMAISLVPLVLLPMVILGGMLRHVADMTNPLIRGAAAVTPSRWAFEGLLTLEDDSFQTGLFGDYATSLPTILSIQCFLLATLLAGVLFALRRRDAH